MLSKSEENDGEEGRAYLSLQYTMLPHLRSQKTVTCRLVHPCRGNSNIMLPLYTVN